MAPKVMKDVKRSSAMKKVQAPAKSKAMQKNKAKVHKVHKKPAQAQGEDSCSEMDDAIEEDQEVEQQEQQQEEQEGDCQRDEDETTEKAETKIGQKEYYRFWKSLPKAPRAVQDAVQKVKGQPTRSGNQQQLAEMAKPLLTKSGTTNFSKALNHCSRKGPKQGKTL